MLYINNFSYYCEISSFITGVDMNIVLYIKHIRDRNKCTISHNFYFINQIQKILILFSYQEKYIYLLCTVQGKLKCHCFTKVIEKPTNYYHSIHLDTLTMIYSRYIRSVPWPSIQIFCSPEKIKMSLFYICYRKSEKLSSQHCVSRMQ